VIHTQRFIHILAGGLDRFGRERQHPSHERRPQAHDKDVPMYTISTTPGDRVDTAATIPDALAALASQLTSHLPHGPVAWKITDPTGTEHRGSGTLNGRLDQLTIAVDELVDELYTQLHRAADQAAAGSAETTRP
jgi:hypothetical protein